MDKFDIITDKGKLTKALDDLSKKLFVLEAWNEGTTGLMAHRVWLLSLKKIDKITDACALLEELDTVRSYVENLSDCTGLYKATPKLLLDFHLALEEAASRGDTSFDHAKWLAERSSPPESVEEAFTELILRPVMEATEVAIEATLETFRNGVPAHQRIDTHENVALKVLEKVNSFRKQHEKHAERDTALELELLSSLSQPTRETVELSHLSVFEPNDVLGMASYLMRRNFVIVQRHVGRSVWSEADNNNFNSVELSFRFILTDKGKAQLAELSSK